MQVQIQSNNTWHDITSYIALGGFKNSRNDIDGPNAGRNIQGTMIRDRVAQKTRIDITLIPLTHDDWSIINNYLQPVSFNFRYREASADPWTSIVVYSNNYSWTHKYTRSDGVSVYDGLTFPIIEV